MTNTEVKPKLHPVDLLAHRPTSQSYKLEATYRVPVGDTVEIVRVSVCRDSVDFQNWGNASLLSTDRKWTTLAVADREVVMAKKSPYAGGMKDADNIEAELVGIVEDLLERSLNILGA